MAFCRLLGIDTEYDLEELCSPLTLLLGLGAPGSADSADASEGKGIKSSSLASAVGCEKLEPSALAFGLGFNLRGGAALFSSLLDDAAGFSAALFLTIFLAISTASTGAGELSTVSTASTGAAGSSANTGVAVASALDLDLALPFLGLLFAADCSLSEMPTLLMTV